jgi:hypothetical protein
LLIQIEFSGSWTTGTTEYELDEEALGEACGKQSVQVFAHGIFEVVCRIYLIHCSSNAVECTERIHNEDRKI